MLISNKRGRFQREPAIQRVAGSLWNPTEGSPYMIKKSLAIALLFLASVVWFVDLAQSDKAKPEITDEQRAKMEAELKILQEQKAEIEARQEKNKLLSEKWQQDLESGPAGRFQAVAMGQSGVIILDTKAGRVWAAGGTAKAGIQIIYMEQVNPYSIQGK
jgi:hypothetical protein